MTKKLECKIVQDLLPSYIEGLTHDVTTKAVDEHLQDCLVCEEICEMMKEPEQKVTDEEPRKLNKFLKKVRMKGLLNGVIIMFITCLVGIGYQKLCLETYTVPTNEIIIRNLSMTSDGKVQFRVSDINNKELAFYKGTANGEGTFFVGRSIFSQKEVKSYYSDVSGELYFSVGRAIIAKKSNPRYQDSIENRLITIDVKRNNIDKIYYRDELGEKLLVWEEGMEISIVDDQE